MKTNGGIAVRKPMDEDLLKALRKGDERLFGIVYDRYYELLCRFANAILHNPGMAEEVVDDVVFGLWQHRLTVDVGVSLRAYLVRGVRNRALNELRNSARRPTVSMADITAADNVAFLDTIFADPQHPLGMLIEKEFECELAESIDSLPRECREVFRMVRIDGGKYEETARRMGISVNTVKYHMRRAMAILDSRLGRYLDIIILYCYFGAN